MGSSSSDEQSDRNRLALSIAVGFTALISSIFYFVTWFTVKKILHKKYPKLIGLIVVAIYLTTVLYLALSSVL